MKLAAAALIVATLFVAGAFFGVGSSPFATQGAPQAIEVEGGSSPPPASPSALPAPAASGSPASSQVPSAFVAVGRRVQSVPLSELASQGSPDAALNSGASGILAAPAPDTSVSTGTLPGVAGLSGITVAPTVGPTGLSPSANPVPTPSAGVTGTVVPLPVLSPTVPPLLQRILDKLTLSPTP